MAPSIKQALFAAIGTGLALQRVSVETVGTIIFDACCVHDGGDERWMVDDVVVKTIQAGQVGFAPSAVVGAENTGEVLGLCVELGAIGRTSLDGLSIRSNLIKKHAGWVGECALRAVARTISSVDLAQRTSPHTNIIGTSISSIIIVGDGLDIFFSRAGSKALTLVEHPSSRTPSTDLMPAFHAIGRTSSETTIGPLVVVLNYCSTSEVEKCGVALAVQAESRVDAPNATCRAREALIFHDAIDVDVIGVVTIRTQPHASIIGMDIVKSWNTGLAVSGVNSAGLAAISAIHA